MELYGRVRRAVRVEDRSERAVSPGVWDIAGDRTGSFDAVKHLVLDVTRENLGKQAKE